MRKAVLRLLVGAGAVFALAASGYAQPELIVGNGYLPYGNLRPIAIGRFESIHKVIWYQHDSSDYEFYLATRDTGGQWQSTSVFSAQSPWMNLWLGLDGSAFMFGSGSVFIDSGGSYIQRTTRGYIVMDNYGLIHEIYEQNGVHYYAVSADTLRTYSYVHPVPQSPDRATIVISPDGGLVSAIFYDGGQIYKYISGAGTFVITDSASIDTFSLYFPDGNDFNCAIDDDGKLFIEYMLSDPLWVERYIWSEGNGPRLIYSWDFPAYSQNQVEICFSFSSGAVIGIESADDFSSHHTFLYYSRDGGNEWTIPLFTLPFGNSSVQRYCTDTLFVVGDDGNGSVFFEIVPVYLFIGDYIDDVELPLPADIHLSNYPNPFNSATTVSFNLPAQADIALRVFDITGGVLTTLYKGHADAGLHSVVWNGQNSSGQPVSSGVYFYRLGIDGDRSVTKRMLLLK